MTSDPQTPPSSSSKRKPLFYVAIAALVVVVVGAAGLFLYLNQQAPEEVSLESAVQDASTASTTSTPSTQDGGIEGTWTIDTSIGEFSFEDATSTFAGFRIEEELASLGAVTAVGRTPEVSGTLTIEGTTLTAATIDADLTAIVTNNSRRDDNVLSALNTDEHPVATFTLTESIELGAGAAEGEVIAVTGVGDLTINGITQSIEIPLEGQLVGDLVVIVGSTEITFADWDVAVPSSPAVVSVDDFGVLEMQLFFSHS